MVQDLSAGNAAGSDRVPDGAFPLSAAQRGMWFAQQALGDVPVTIAQYIEVDGDLDLDMLTAASVMAGKEFGSGYLRILDVDGMPYQMVDRSIDDTIRLRDFRGETDPAAAAMDWMRREYSAPVDLLNSRLVALWLLRLDEHRWFWFSRIHHVALDGYGAMAMITRIAEIYTAMAAGEEIPPAKALDVETVFEDEAKYRDSTRFEKDREYWLTRTADLPAPVSLAGRTAPVGSHARIVSAALPPALSEAADAAVDALQTAQAPLVVAAFAAYLARMTDTEDVVVARDGTWIYLETVNVNARAWLSEISSQVFG